MLQRHLGFLDHPAVGIGLLDPEEHPGFKEAWVFGPIGPRARGDVLSSVLRI